MTKEKIAYVPVRELKNLIEDHAKVFTRINIAFAVLENGKVLIKDSEEMKYLEEIRKFNPELKIIISIGGAGAFGFSTMAMTKETRQVFLDSMEELILEYSFDGVDLDWEFPGADWGGDFSPNDKENFTTLLKEMRQKLDSMGGKKYYLSIAAGVGQWFVDTTEVDKYIDYLDDIMLMTYDLRGFGQEITGHHTTLYTKKDDVLKMSAHDGIKLLNEHGVSNDKIVLGYAQYSRHWTGVEDVNHGLLQKADPNGGDYLYDYPKLQDDIIDNPDYQEFFDEEAMVPWSYSKDKKIFVTYDNARSVQEKVKYVKNNDLKGLMYWRYVDWPDNPLIEEMKELD